MVYVPFYFPLIRLTLFTNLIRLPFNSWSSILQVLVPLFDQFCTAVGPVLFGVCRKCVVHGLIDQNDFDVFKAQELLGNRAICDQLLSKLKGTGQTGFDEFKRILSTSPRMSSPVVLLQSIQDVERKKAEGVYMQSHVLFLHVVPL